MNVVLVIIDTLRRDAVSAYDSDADTPHLSRIAERSIVFEDFTAVSCWTMPTHGSMLTGQYPSIHRGMEPTVSLSPSVPLVSELLGESGIQAHGINIPPPLAGEAGFRDRGWDQWQNTNRISKYRQVSRLFRTWTEVGLRRSPRRAISPSFIDALRENYRTRWAINDLVDAITEPGDSFAFANLFSPHRPYKPITGEADDVSESARKLAWRDDDYHLRYNYGDLDVDESVIKENRLLYDYEVAWIDENLGRLFDGLETKGLLNETVVLITADHGELFDEPTEPPYVAHRNSLHPALIDVPFLLYHPDIEPGRDDRLASQVDVAPTILDAAGVLNNHRETVDKMAGHSLLSDSEHNVVFAEMGRHDVSKSKLEAAYGLDFTPYHRAAKVTRTSDYTVEFRSDGPPIGCDRRDSAATVPEAEIKRLRALVDEQLSWEVEDTEETVTEAVRERLKDVGYLG